MIYIAVNQFMSLLILLAGGAVMVVTTAESFRLSTTIKELSYSQPKHYSTLMVIIKVGLCLFVASYVFAIISNTFEPEDGSSNLVFSIICLVGAVFCFVLVLSQKAAIQSLKQNADEVMRAFVNAAELKDERTKGHSQHVRDIVALFYNYMPPKLKSQLNVHKLTDAAMLHDIGKLGVENDILNKTGPLDEKEWEIIKSHPRMGQMMLRNTCYSQIGEWVLYHHEQPDGNGYYHLPHSQIPLESKIIRIADTYSALTSTRSYRKSTDHTTAIETLKQQAGIQFDAELIEIFETIPQKKLDILER